MWGPVINPYNIFLHLNVDLSVFLSFVISSNIQILMNERALCKKEKIPLVPSANIEFVKSQLTVS